MTDEKQINNTKNERRDNYCIRIQKALQYKGTDDHEDLPSILVAFEKELTNELLPKNAVVLTREEYEGLKMSKDFDYGYHEGFKNTEAYYENVALPQIRKETAREILQEVGKCCGDYQWFKNLCKQFGVEVK